MTAARHYNAVRDMVDRNVERGLGSKPAFVDPDRSLTYAELQSGTNRVANLLGTLGVRREKRVALLMQDTVDFPIVFWGAIRAGVVPVCLNTLLTTPQYDYLLSNSRAEVLFVSNEVLERIGPSLERSETLKHVVVCGASDSGYPVLDRLLADVDASFRTVETRADETAFWLYSSGTTGRPKGVRHVHTSPLYVAENYGRKILDIQPGDVCFSAAKLFFAYGHGAGMASPMSVGATTLLLPGRPTPEAVLGVLREGDPTLFFGVPTLYRSLLGDPSFRPEAAPRHLRLCISAGEGLPENIAAEWRARTGVEIIDGVGSTEMLHAFVSNRPGDVRSGTSGRAVPGYRLKLVDETGSEVGVDVLGEMLVSGGSVAAGYWCQRAKNRAAFLGQWFRTGDKYYMDREGYYHYCGRSDDMFKVSGRWVSPFEVEQALQSHAAVLEAAVVGCEDADGLIKPKAFVVLRGAPPCDDLFQKLKDHVKTSVGLWKYPRWIEVVDALPKTATGKIKRFLLRGS